MRLAVLLGLLSGCWTASQPPPDPPAPVTPALPSSFDITLERTRCFGACPAYKVTIDGDGRVRWTGEDHVVAIGERRATVPPKRIAELQRMIDVVDFFARDGRGVLETVPDLDCARGIKTTSCSFKSTIHCFDGTSAIVTVRRKDRTHTVRNDHCEPSPLDDLEALIDDVARTTAWIGERVTSPHD